MKPYVVKTPKFVQRIFPKRIWAFPVSEAKEVYLTFDDGPIPEVTPWVLELLASHQAKATFFCIGDNIRKHPSIFQQVVAQGHCIGNHTFHHLNGWKTGHGDYMDDVSKFETLSKKASNAKLFRPPYGKITSKQAKTIQEQGYKVVMWDVLSADFDTTISEEKCLQNVLQHIQPGSIVVFHDSLKAEKRLRYVLPKVLAFISEKNWKCASIQLQESNF